MTERPYCLRSRAIGTLPGRKPGMRMRLFSSSSRWATWPSISAASTTTLYSRFRPSADNSVTCISLRLAFWLQRAGPETPGDFGAGEGTRTPHGRAATRT